MDPSPENRFARHLTLKEIGHEGQARIASARVLIIGLGGLGSPAALYLAGAGVGELILADFDTVEASNLHRQIAHSSDRLGALKTASAREACLAIQPDCSIRTLDHVIDEDDIDEALDGVDVVLDCSDNFATRLAINAACVRRQLPLVIGAAIRFDGQLLVVDQRSATEATADSACYRCFVGDRTGAGDICAQEGILGPVVGTIGTLQALEALKIITGAGRSLAGRLLLFDGLNLEFQTLELPRNPHCPVCQQQPGST